MSQSKLKSAKQQSILFMILMLLGITTSFWFFLQNAQQKQTIRNQYTQLKLKNDTLLQVQNMLEERNHQIETIQDSLAYALERLNNTIVKDDKIQSKNEQLIRSARNASYNIGLYGLNVDATTLKKITDYVREEGYVIEQSLMLKERTSWLDYNNAIFYYKKQDATQATQLANTFKQLTGKSFTTKIGAGTGIPKGTGYSYLRVHLVK